MNSVIGNAANTVYERARFRSAQTVRDEKRNFAQRIATRRSSSNLPLSGPEFQAVLKISGDHVERCIRERFESYRDAFKQVEIVPTDQDFREILNGVKAARDQEVRQAAVSLEQYAHAHRFAIP